MKLAGLRFQPGIWPTLATVIVLPILLSLGFWQLDRAEEKRALLRQYNEKYVLAPVALNNLNGNYKNNEFRQVQISGKFIQEKQILLDNKLEKGQAGYHVITPLKITNTNKIILINRGWIALGKSRTQLPDVSISNIQTDAITVSGRLRQPQLPGMKLGEQQLQPGWPKLLQWIDWQQVKQVYPGEIVPMVLELDPGSDFGYERKWSVLHIEPEKSTSYAVQWFTMAAIVLGLFIGLNFRKVK